MTLPISTLPFVRKRIESSVWFKGWTIFEIEALMSKCTFRRCIKSELVYHDGMSQELVLILSGSVWTCLRNDQKVSKFGIAYPSTLIGLSRLLGQVFFDEPRYEFYASEDVEVLVIPTPALLHHLERRPDLWRYTAQAAILYQRHCVKLALVLSSGSTKDRVISAIYQFGFAAAIHASRLPHHELLIPQDELAVLIQSSRQHVNRALRELEEEGLVKIGYRRITVIDALEIERRALARFSIRTQAEREGTPEGNLDDIDDRQSDPW